MNQKFSAPLLMIAGVILTIGAVSLVTNPPKRFTVSRPYSQAAAAPSPASRFDLDKNGIVDNRDVQIVLNALNQRPPNLRADVTGDGKVNLDDVRAIRSYMYGVAKDYKSYFDLNNDGRVDNKDVQIVMQNVGKSGNAALIADVDNDGKVTNGDVNAIGVYVFDLNNDGLVTQADKDFLNTIIFSPAECPRGKNCDLNGDGKVNAADIVTLQNFMLFAQAMNSPPKITSAPADPDVTYIERTPKYPRYCITYINDVIPVLCDGTSGDKRYPDVGESVTYVAHIINKGSSPSGSLRYDWLVDGTVKQTGALSQILPGQEATTSYQTVWQDADQKIQFIIRTPPRVFPSKHNSLTIGSRDLTLSIFVEQGEYDLFNKATNMAGTHSFEDWIQAHIAKMNEHFALAKYLVSPKGILDRVSVNRIVVADELDHDGSLLHADPNAYLSDGTWQFTDQDPTNATGNGGAWQSYINKFARTIDWGLIHELTHQLGIIDLYRMNLANDPAKPNNGVHVLDSHNHQIPVTRLPTVAFHQILFRNPGLMGGGDITPYTDGSYYESHTAGCLNSNYQKRRGYYGECLFDVPALNYIKVLDKTGFPLAQAYVRLYQQTDAGIDNTPEIVGTTDDHGMLLLPNRPVTSVTTATGHTLRDNPFGQINVTGSNGTFLVWATKGSQEGFGWFMILDANLAYWMGKKNQATYEIKTTDFPSGFDLNKDGKVDNKDVQIVIQNVGKPASAMPAADLNSDGKITADDVFSIGNYVFDLNDDGLVDKADQDLLNTIIFASAKCPAGKNCDLNGDGRVSVADSLALTNYIQAHWMPSF